MTTDPTDPTPTTELQAAVAQLRKVITDGWSDYTELTAALHDVERAVRWADRPAAPVREPEPTDDPCPWCGDSRCWDGPECEANTAAPVEPEPPDPPERYEGEPDACHVCGDTESHPLMAIGGEFWCADCYDAGREGNEPATPVEPEGIKTDATGRRYCGECEERLVPPGEPIPHARDCPVVTREPEGEGRSEPVWCCDRRGGACRRPADHEGPCDRTWCPQCGAIYYRDDDGTCPRCGSIVVTGEVLDSITAPYRERAERLELERDAALAQAADAETRVIEAQRSTRDAVKIAERLDLACDAARDDARAWSAIAVKLERERDEARRILAEEEAALADLRTEHIATLEQLTEDRRLLGECVALIQATLKDQGQESDA